VPHMCNLRQLVMGISPESQYLHEGPCPNGAPTGRKGGGVGPGGRRGGAGGPWPFSCLANGRQRPLSASPALLAV